MRQLFTLTQKSRLRLDREWAGLGTLEASLMTYFLQRGLTYNGFTTSQSIIISWGPSV